MKHILILLLALVAVKTHAQILTDNNCIEVTGTAELEIVPDIIIISVQLREFEENRVKTTIEKLDADFKRAVKEAGINMESVSVSDVSLNTLIQRRKDREVFADKFYQVKFSTLEGLTLFIEKIKQVRIHEVQIIKLSHTQIEKYNLDTKVMALKAADRKAEVLANTLNVKKGKVLYLREDSGGIELDFGNRWNGQANAMNYSGDVDFRELEMSFRKIKLTAEVFVRYTLE